EKTASSDWRLARSGQASALLGQAQRGREGVYSLSAWYHAIRNYELAFPEYIGPKPRLANSRKKTAGPAQTGPAMY
ncbi:MAG: hypothetical protein ACLP9L_15180, partial [Thermoguttaceae bacterium]